MNNISIYDSLYKICKGEIEFIFKDRNGCVVGKQVQPNLIKIFAKEILSHQMPYSKIWNPNASSSSGAWEDSGIDPLEEFAPKYILFGASYDENGVKLGFDDDRYYTQDPVTGQFTPKRLNPGAEFDGGLINGIPLAEPFRPLKRVESISFEPTYQPSGTPLLQDDVRAINNVVVLETTLTTDEYNGFGLTGSDSFSITEVALAGGKVLNSIGSCECTPRNLFLEGPSSDPDVPLAATASGGDVITIDSSETEVNLIKEGDQIKIGTQDSSGTFDELDQVSPFYLVVSKQVGGRDIQLDRAVVDSDNSAITGSIGVFRDTLRIFSHRILDVPVDKSSILEVLVRWRIVMN